MSNEFNGLSSCTAAGLVLAASLIAANASADIVAQHSGGSDPETEYWSLKSSGVTSGVAQSGTEVTASGSHEFWKLQDLSTTGVSTYRRPSCLGAMEADWTLEASLRIVDSPLIPSFGVGATGIFIDDGFSYWGYYIGNDVAGAINPSVNYAFSTPVDTRTDYVTYRVDFSANGPGHQDDTADFLIDGALIAEDVGRAGLYASSERIIQMGSVGTPGISDANYERLEVDYEIAPDVDGDGIANGSDNCLIAAADTAGDTVSS